MKKIVCLAFALVIVLCGCNKNTSDTTGRNYFGGEGEFRYWDNSYSVWGDNNNLYFYGPSNYEKLNTQTKTLTAACPIPGCAHSYDSTDCRTFGNRFYAFNGELVMLQNERIVQNDGTVYEKGYLYRCEADDREKIFENTIPDELDDSKREGIDEGLDFAQVQGDYLTVYGGIYYAYMLDKDFNIKCTIFDNCSAPRVFYVNDEYYYIDNLYRLIKLDVDTGKGEPVELGMKITEGATDGKVIWFSNDLMELCAFDPKSGEVKKYADNAIIIKSAGNCVKYREYDTGKDLILNVSNGNIKDVTEKNYDYDSFAYWDGKYYLSGIRINEADELGEVTHIKEYTDMVTELDEDLNKTAEYLLED